MFQCTLDNLQQQQQQQQQLCIDYAYAQWSTTNAAAGSNQS